MLMLPNEANLGHVICQHDERSKEQSETRNQFPSCTAGCNFNQVFLNSYISVLPLKRSVTPSVSRVKLAVEVCLKA